MVLLNDRSGWLPESPCLHLVPGGVIDSSPHVCAGIAGGSGPVRADWGGDEMGDGGLGLCFEWEIGCMAVSCRWLR